MISKVVIQNMGIQVVVLLLLILVLLCVPLTHSRYSDIGIRPRIHK